MADGIAVAFQTHDQCLPILAFVVHGVWMLCVLRQMRSSTTATIQPLAMGAEGLEPPTFALYGRDEPAG